VSEDPRSQPWVRSLQDLVAVLPGLLSDRLELLALELHRAGRSLVQIMALVLATAILVTTAWFVLCGGLSEGVNEINTSRVMLRSRHAGAGC
jgi:uncharacterized membrane protein YqjE